MEELFMFSGSFGKKFFSRGEKERQRFSRLESAERENKLMLYDGAGMEALYV